MKTQIEREVSKAVDLVNTHAGKACVFLEFEDQFDVDFVANSATYRNGAFQFSSGIETYSGSVEELAKIRVELIKN